MAKSSNRIIFLTLQMGTSQNQDPNLKNYPCETCAKSFVRVADLYRHIRTHTGERPFQCNVCGASFAQKGTLKRHYNAIHKVAMH